MFTHAFLSAMDYFYNGNRGSVTITVETSTNGATTSPRMNLYR